MGLLKRLVVAIEKIAERQPMTAEQMQKVLQTALRNQLILEEECRKAKTQESYNWLKTKQEKDLKLSDEEKASIEWGDNQVKIGKLNKYTGA
jgi:hypothetical protein